MKWESPEGCQAKRGLHPALWHVEVYAAAETASYHLVASGLHSKLGFLWQWYSWKWYCDSQTNCCCRQVSSKEVAWKETKKKTKPLSHKIFLILCCQTPATFLLCWCIQLAMTSELSSIRGACEARYVSCVSLADLFLLLAEKTWHLLGTLGTKAFERPFVKSLQRWHVQLVAVFLLQHGLLENRVSFSGDTSIMKQQPPVSHI